jgi:filamentous hemagglutinin family protein
MMGSLVANPTGGNVVGGNATINNVGNVTNINQTTDKSIIEWDSFSIDLGETTNFNLPNASSAVLNRVTGLNQSIISGILNSNGNVFLINENGILITKDGLINVNSFIGSTHDVANEDFMGGKKLNFIGGSGKFENHGTINANGSIIIIATEIENAGSLNADEVYLRETEGNATIKVRAKLSDINDEIEAHNGNIYGMVINQAGIKRGQTVIEKNGQKWLVDQRGSSGVYEFNDEALAVSLGFKRMGNSDNYKIGKDTGSELSIDANGNLVPFPEIPVVIEPEIIPVVVVNPAVTIEPELTPYNPLPVVIENITPIVTPNQIHVTIDTSTTTVEHSTPTHKEERELQHTHTPSVVHEDSPILPFKKKEHDFDTYYRDNTTTHEYDTYSRGDKDFGINVVMHHSFSDYLDLDTDMGKALLNNFVNLN